MADQIGVAIFGLGRAGAIHFQNLAHGHRPVIKYVIDIDVDRARSIIEKYHRKDTKILSPEQSHEVYNDKDVKAVFVCTPTFTHEEIVRAAIKHGKGVFCEKPIAEKMESIKTCYEEAETVGVPLLCAFNRRFDPGLAQIHKRMKEGEIGKIHLIKTCSRDSPFPPMEYLKISGGIYHDCAVHDIDLVCWMLGEYPSVVHTMAHAQAPELQEINDVDTVIISMKFPSGVLACVDLSRHSTYGYDQRLEILGSEGMIQNENHHSSAVRSSTRSGIHGDPLKHSFPQRYAESYVNAVDHFLDVLEGKAQLEISKEQTLRVSCIASACEESWRSGKPVAILDHTT